MCRVRVSLCISLFLCVYGVHVFVSLFVCVELFECARVCVSLCFYQFCFPEINSDCL